MVYEATSPLKAKKNGDEEEQDAAERWREAIRRSDAFAA